MNIKRISDCKSEDDVISFVENIVSEDPPVGDLVRTMRTQGKSWFRIALCLTRAKQYEDIKRREASSLLTTTINTVVEQ